MTAFALAPFVVCVDETMETKEVKPQWEMPSEPEKRQKSPGTNKLYIGFKSKKISNDQELIQSDPTSCPQNLGLNEVATFIESADRPAGVQIKGSKVP